MITPTVADLLMLFDPAVILTGLAIFAARIFDVAIGTIRTIVTVQGRTTLAFVLAVFEVTIWITVVSTVIHKVNEIPILIFFYSFGYATGNVVGIIVERKIALGMIILKIFSQKKGPEIARMFRDLGQAVTTFEGEGKDGPVLELYLVCRRRDLKWMLPRVLAVDGSAFYVVEQARDVRKILRPVTTPLGGWRQRHNRK